MQRRSDRAILRLVVATGISSVAAQLYVIREFLAQFQGNEFVIALILFSWLILGGLGTLAAQNLSDRFCRPLRKNLACCALLLAAIPSIQILAIRLLRDLVFVHGSSVGFYQTFAYIFLLTAPYCLLLGFVLLFSLFVLRREQEAYSGTRIYMADGLGDVSGGALFSFFLIYFLSPLQAVLVANLPLLLAAPLLVTERRPRFFCTMGSVALLFLLLAFLLLEPLSLARPEGKLVHYQESKYGRIEVHQDQDQFTLFSDGTPLFSNQNLEAAQEAIHFPLSQVSQPQHILLISAASGMLTELAKYTPVSIDYVELDPEITKTGFNFGMLAPIPGLNIVHQDARAWLAGMAKTYDAIIVSLPEPDTYQVNRFYTSSFFKLAAQHLAPGGVFSFSLQGYDSYLDEVQRWKISSLFNTVSASFQHILLLPGQKVFFLCSNETLNADIPALLAAKEIKAEFITFYYYGNIDRERIASLRNLIDPDIPTNSDFSPQLMHIMFSQWFVKFDTSPWWFIASLLPLLAIYMYRLKKEEFVMFSTGFITMGSEILVIFVFQIFYGYIYTQIGIIITVFLAGLLPGAWLGERLRLYFGKDLLVFLELTLLGLLTLFWVRLFVSEYRLEMWFLLLFGFLVSLLCGSQFPVILNRCGADNRAASHTFSADLLGAACGTLVTSVIFIPFFGIIWATVGLIGLKIMSLVMVVRGHEKTG